jgi:hypothetical protein
VTRIAGVRQEAGISNRPTTGLPVTMDPIPLTDFHPIG